MVRPCFLVIDREYSGSISTRKLVIETAKFNVLTAYSGAEAINTFTMFPAISGVVLDGAINDMPACDVVAAIKQRDAKLPVVVISAPGAHNCPQADYMLDSFDPRRLLALLESLVPAATAAIEKHNEQLNQDRS